MPGFRLDKDGQNCLGECCYHGNYSCSCMSGFRLDKDGQNCLGECCCHGNYSCSCMSGFRLDKDGQNCLGGCCCHGNYSCSCMSGFCLIKYGQNCLGGCCCHGNYNCSCMSGFRLDRNGQNLSGVSVVVMVTIQGEAGNRIPHCLYHGAECSPRCENYRTLPLAAVTDQRRQAALSGFERSVALSRPASKFFWLVLYSYRCMPYFQLDKEGQNYMIVRCCHKPPARYVKFGVAHAPGMPRTFSPPLTSKETAG